MSVCRSSIGINILRISLTDLWVEGHFRYNQLRAGDSTYRARGLLWLGVGGSLTDIRTIGPRLSRVWINVLKAGAAYLQSRVQCVKECRGDLKYRAGRMDSAIFNGLVTKISNHRIWIASICVACWLIRSIICGRSKTRIIVRVSMGVRGIVATVLVAVVNSRLPDSGSGGRWASEYLFRLPHTLV